ncbi:MAG: putative Oxidoreductase, short chain dehydrogenase/reductase family [Panacagrimonas sp.]|nr:SDR family oxidoreductase [Panacagrimonas sp.]MCC2655156.1 putative Oxidoreductase, short chain dehydrogenase/reductase family [Panacagrimonas sp.]
MKRVDARVAIVTGGRHGIGAAIAQRLRDDGARVAVLDREPPPRGRRVRNALYLECDVSDESAVEDAVRDVVRWGRRIDVLVNNAGVADPHAAPPGSLTLEAWRRVLDVNLTGPFLLSKHAVPHLRRAKGTILNIASTRAWMSEPDTLAYAASKGGLVALTHALAISLGPKIRVNGVAPGWIATKGNASLRRIDHAQHPVGRVGRPEDVAGLVAWLASAESGFMTGQTLVIDGGMTRKMIYAA